jgi:hypothetical protein
MHGTHAESRGIPGEWTGQSLTLHLLAVGRQSGTFTARNFRVARKPPRTPESKAGPYINRDRSELIKFTAEISRVLKAAKSGLCSIGPSLIAVSREQSAQSTRMDNG